MISIVKMKYNGRKQKFKVLHPMDVITSNCIQQCVVDYERVPLCYEAVVAKVDFKNGAWNSTHCAGDMVCDDHLHRVYLMPL